MTYTISEQGFGLAAELVDLGRMVSAVKLESAGQTITTENHVVKVSLENRSREGKQSIFVSFGA
jgi:hypothetical protein